MRNLKLLCLIAFLVMGPSTYALQHRKSELAAFPQFTHGEGLQVASTQTRACEKRPEDVEAVSKIKDLGFDFAVVVTTQAAMREEPNISSKSLKDVKRSNFLSLVKRDPVRSWYKVIEVDSATEGWINECDVIIKLSANTSTGPPMVEESIGTKDDPTVSITNLERATDLRLRLNGILYVIPANTTKTLTVKPGKYEYYGYSPGIRPALGKRDFKGGHKYTWTFQIGRKTDRN